MIDYKQGKIYKILNNQHQCMDIGSTTSPLRIRWYNHRYNRDGWNIVLVESYWAKDRKDLEMREEYWRLAMKPTLNRKRCSNGIPYKHTDKQYNTCKRFKELYFPRIICVCGRRIIARTLERHQTYRIHRRLYMTRTLAREIYFRQHPIWTLLAFPTFT